MKILLVEDHKLVRAGIVLLLEELPNVSKVFEAGNGVEALEVLKSQEIDVMITDLAMPEMNGFRTIEHASKLYPHLKIIALTMYANEEYARRAFSFGASGYVVKGQEFRELKEALEAVVTGKRYLSPVIASRAVDLPEPAESSLQLLTTRQREVLQLIAESKTTKEIATILSVSVKTVETHRQDLMERLGIYDVAGLVRYAMRVGMVGPEYMKEGQ